jgi:methionine aminopeptidase
VVAAHCGLLVSAPVPALLVFVAYRFSVVRTYCGHGIGELFHCAPNVPHYSGNKAVGVMKEGHIFTVEPMINAGEC